jgi:cholesterol oxidase
MLGLYGILRLTPLQHAWVASPAALGGGSTLYACALYRAPSGFFNHPQWAGLGDWAATLEAHYQRAESMLGVEPVPLDSEAQRLLRQLAGHFGTDASFQRATVGIFFAEPGRLVPDPYFAGDGPDRTGCTRCGACMLGCRVGAKNTLLKNYLWFAERLGARMFVEHQVVDIQPLGRADGSDGYRVTTERPGAWFDKHRRVFTTLGVVLAAGVLGSNRLLAQCKFSGSLPAISDRLGQLVRTANETILALRLADAALEPWRDVAISARIAPRSDIQIEFATWGRQADLLATQFGPPGGAAPRRIRALWLLREILRHPLRCARLCWPWHWSRRTLLLLVVQTPERTLRLQALKPGLVRGVRLRSEPDNMPPRAELSELGRQALAWLGRQAGGQAQGLLLETLTGIPCSGHLLGGAVIARDAAGGVVDQYQQVFGYQRLLICDGSVLPAYPGSHPALTIAALAEHAMSHIPPAQSVGWSPAPTGKRRP